MLGFDALQRRWHELQNKQGGRLAIFRSRFSRRFPGVYLILTLAAAALGHLWLFAPPLLSAGLFVHAIAGAFAALNWQQWIQVVIELVLAGGSAWLTWKLLHTSVEPPRGIRLDLARTPVLRDTILRLKNHHRTPDIDQVLLSPEFEFELLRTPRQGLPIALCNTLRIGIPLLLTSAPQHADVELARRIGQLKGFWRRPTAWVDISAQIFEHYANNLPQNWTSPSLYPRLWMSWYAPVFRFLSRPVLLGEELHADQCAMDTVNDLQVRESFANSEVMQRYLEGEFWPRYLALAARHATPPMPPFTALQRALRAPPETQRLKHWLNEALEAREGRPASRPALRLRLDGIGHDRVEPPPVLETNAAEAWFGTELADHVRPADQAWVQAHLAGWRERYRRAEGERRRVDNLEHKLENTGRLDGEEAWELTLLLQRHRSKAEILVRYRELMSIPLADARVYFFVGRYLLGNRDSGGVKALERAMELDDRHTVPACRLITQFMVETGAKKYAQEYRRRALAYQARAA